MAQRTPEEAWGSANTTLHTHSLEFHGAFLTRTSLSANEITTKKLSEKTIPVWVRGNWALFGLCFLWLDLAHRGFQII